VIDLQDVGSRYYVQATMLYCLEAASRHGLRAMVLDRPNPLGGDAVEGRSCSRASRASSARTRSRRVTG
jgi:uncharacterized protein YbbC (DUF1343 family)